jgi:hypothetical protein
VVLTTFGIPQLLFQPKSEDSSLDELGVSFYGCISCINLVAIGSVICCVTSLLHAKMSSIQFHDFVFSAKSLAWMTSPLGRVHGIAPEAVP